MTNFFEFLISDNMTTGYFTLAITLGIVFLTNKEVLNKFMTIHKNDLELQKNNYIIIKNNKKDTSKEDNTDLTTGYRLKQDTLLELSEKRNTDKFFKKISFLLAIVMSIIGTIILFVGIILSFIFETKIGWIITSSGIIIEIVASIYFWLVNKTIKEVKENSIQLENTKNQITAMELVEKIENTQIRDTVYVEMIKSLIDK